MKFLKVFLITLISLLLSGCYTQLQYSQTMKKITDKEEEKKEEVYSSEEEKADTKDDEEYTEYDEDYIPIYYKDYEYADKYKDWACSSCNVYNFYGSNWYGYDPNFSFYSHLTLSPYYFYSWHRPYHRYYGHPYYSRFSISLSWGWGSPYYHGFYDPFFDPYYNYYWYSYRPYAYNYRYFYGGYYYGNKKDRINPNVRYGPRSIGTNRVSGDNNRSRNGSSVTRRSATVTSKPTVRTRSSVGTTRTRSSSDRGTGSSVRTRSRSSSNDGGSSRSRSRDNFQSDISRDRIYIDRTGDSEPVMINRNQLRYIRYRTVNLNDNSTRSLEDMPDIRRRLEASKRNLNRTTPTFFERMKNFFETNTSRIVNTSRIRSNSNGTVRSRSTSSSSRSSVSRSDNSSSRSSVTRSRSSSSDSRSRGSSSRSRSGGSSSGGSERSRGN